MASEFQSHKEKPDPKVLVSAAPRLNWQGPDAAPRPPAGKVRIELLTDPWSVWCWGLEPVRRAIDLRYPSIEFRNLVGGMFPHMPKPDEVGFDVERFFAVVQRTTGMPITAAGIRRDPADSTYPSCRFVHAVRLIEPTYEKPYLRALREAAYLDEENISRPEIGERVAASLGVGEKRFREQLDSGRAQSSFEAQLKVLHEQELHAYPTFLITTSDRTVKIEGYQSLPALLGLAEGLSGRSHRPLPDPPMELIVPAGERVATREVAEVLGVSVEHAFERLEEGKSEGWLKREEHETGTVWVRKDAQRARPPPTRRSVATIEPAP